MKRIYQIAAGDLDIFPQDQDMKMILGGKGAGLYNMVTAGLNVPPAFCITTQVCNEYRKLADETKDSHDEVEAYEKFVDDLMEEVCQNMVWLHDKMNQAVMVSVRSGAPVSMPGMMDTILNVGMTDLTLNFWVEKIGERPAYDSYRRLIQMLGHTAYGVPSEPFENELSKWKTKAGVDDDAGLEVNHLKEVVAGFKQIFQAATQQEFPQDPVEQLKAAVFAVFNSWMNPRAIEYRKQNKIPESMGTAVNVQAMVFGNMGDDSGTGVLFTRNPSTGEPGMYGEFLQNAQGEDVVAGIRTPVNIHKMPEIDPPKYVEGAEVPIPKSQWHEVYDQLTELCHTLEIMYDDMVDIEFTVQQGKLFVLQSRVGKRSAQAAFKIAVDLVEEGVIGIDEALSRLTVDQFKIVRRPSIAPGFNEPAHVTGLPGCPGVAVGKPVFDAQSAVNCTEPCIMVTHETNPDDIAGMAAAVGILTQTGGATSHAAVVARAMDKPCVVGCTDLDLTTLHSKAAKNAFNRVTIDGATGRVWFDIEVPVVDSSNRPEVRTVMEWALDKLGWAESVVFAEHPDPLRKRRIMAANWWGDEDVADVVLEEIAELEDRSMVVLDVTSPDELRPSHDLALDMAFAVPNKSGFSGYLYACLQNESKKLKGLTVVGFPTVFNPVLISNGFKVPKEATTLADLLDGSPVEVTQEFVQVIVGGHDAWTKLTQALAKAGTPVGGLPKAVPAEYATFVALKG